MRKDQDADALKGAEKNFAELVGILDAALIRATRIQDHELVERLSRAKAAAERSGGLIAELRDMLVSERKGDRAQAQ